MELGKRQEVEILIKSILVSDPSSTLHSLEDAYYDEVGSKIPYKGLGYSNLETFLRSNPSLFKVDGSGPTATVNIVQLGKSSHIQDMVVNQKKPSKKHKANYRRTSYHNAPTKPKINFKVTEYQYHQNQRTQWGTTTQIRGHERQLYKQTNKHRMGDITKHLETLSILHNEQNEDIFEEGTDSSADKPKLYVHQIAKSSDVVEELSDDHYQQAISQDEPKNDLKTVGHDGCIGSSDRQEAIPRSAIDEFVWLVDSSVNKTTFGHHIPQYEIPTSLKISNIFEMYITEVHDPYKFWFHINREKPKLTSLMDQMQRHYECMPEELFLIPPPNLVPGQVCAVHYNEYWHRGQIVSSANNRELKVFLVDYGSVVEAPPNKVKYLAAEFCELCSQAIRGCLSHVKPKGLHWNSHATKEFVEMVFQKILFAKISEINTNERILYMVLCDTSKSDVVQINSSLVNKNWATIDEEWNTAQHKNGTMSRHTHRRETFPTFSMIENGEYPSRQAIVKLLEIGIDYERIVDNNLFHPDKVHKNGKSNTDMTLFEILPYYTLLKTNPFRFDILKHFRKQKNAKK